MSDVSGPWAEREAFNALGVLLYRLLSEGDERIELSVSATVATSSPDLLAFNPAGRYPTPSGRANSVRGSVELWQAIDTLRAAHYKPQLGTWFSAHITVGADGSATAECNYDAEPEWEVPIDPIAYVTDLEAFPRDEAHQPEWLKQKLVEGRARLAARDK
ncbi:hypothetical protein EV379_0430 [Microterricola gilva]|uniref:Uncharacterized protein n=1 Tax=Microterricola gilva TaxID=393267 RepID=A0A4V2GAG1_9MICO|nr:hypothetical protein [Microterricola gilva]RZU64136.1 hypothetical protein EV379_0430 [Microterricola gilva]